MKPLLQSRFCLVDLVGVPVDPFFRKKGDDPTPVVQGGVKLWLVIQTGEQVAAVGAEQVAEHVVLPEFLMRERQIEGCIVVDYGQLALQVKQQVHIAEAILTEVAVAILDPPVEQ
ncbi:hypothetical protein D3C78_1642260 [compost metagenome]